MISFISAGCDKYNGSTSAFSVGSLELMYIFPLLNGC